MSEFADQGHLIALAATVILALALCAMARLWPGRLTNTVCGVLGTALILNEAYCQVWQVQQGGWSMQYGLPLYLCDVAAFIAGAALLRPQPLLAEVTYFWAIAGTLQGLLTPDTHHDFMSYQYLQYYIDHVGVVVAALVLVAGRGITPRRGAWLRVFGLTALFTVLVGAADIATGGNYMYLRQVPGSGSMLNFMGPWPWYIISGVGVAGIALLLLDLPFRRRRGAAVSPA